MSKPVNQPIPEISKEQRKTILRTFHRVLPHRVKKIPGGYSLVFAGGDKESKKLDNTDLLLQLGLMLKSEMGATRSDLLTLLFVSWFEESESQ